MKFMHLTAFPPFTGLISLWTLLKDMKLLVYFVLIAIGLSRWAIPVHDPDLGWQLLGGQWILEHGSLPQYDFINGLNSNWHNYHWLAQIILFKLYSWGGFPLLRTAFGCFMAIFFCLVGNIVYRSLGRRPSNILWMLVSVFSCLFLVTVSSIRPQMMSLFGLTVALHILIGKRHFELLSLFLLTAFVANLHVYWIAIPALWGCMRVLPSMLRKKKHPMYAWSGLAVLLASGLCTPFGTQTYLLVWDYLHIPPILKSSIAEFRGAFFADVSVQISLLAYIAYFARSFRFKRFLAQIGPGTLALLSPIFAIWSVKYIALLGILSLPYMSRSLQQGLLKLLRPDADRERMLLFAAGIPLALVGGLFSLLQAPWLAANQNEFFLEDHFGFRACQSIARHKFSNLSERDFPLVLTHFNTGGWCRWAMDQENHKLDIRVSMDGRTQYIPERRFEEQFSLFNAKRDWQTTLNRLAPDAILVAKDRALASVLKLDPKWDIYFQDKNFIVFIRAD